MPRFSAWKQILDSSAERWNHIGLPELKIWRQEFRKDEMSRICEVEYQKKRERYIEKASEICRKDTGVFG